MLSKNLYLNQKSKHQSHRLNSFAFVLSLLSRNRTRAFVFLSFGFYLFLIFWVCLLLARYKVFNKALRRIQDDSQVSSLSKFNYFMELKMYPCLNLDIVLAK